MTAAITDPYKKISLDLLKADVSEGNNRYYMGIGRAEAWNANDNAPAELDSDISNLRFTAEARTALQSVKVVEKVGFVVPRVNWAEGTIYSPYSDAVSGNEQNNPYYVMNSNLRVYIVLEQPKDTEGNPIPSTTKPAGVTRDFKTADGYVWRYLYQIGPEDANAFLTTNFIPVQKVDDVKNPPVTAVEVEQDLLQNQAVGGEIANIQLLKPGSGYENPVTVTIAGDGTGAQAFAYVEGGFIRYIRLDSDGAGTVLRGSGYTQGSVSIVGGNGSGAEAKLVYTSLDGIGADPTIDLRSSALMFHTEFHDNEHDTILATNDFRQVSLLRNINDFGVDTGFTGNTGNALKKLKLDEVVNNFLQDKVIKGASTGAKAYVAHYDAGTKEIWYYQTSSTLFAEFQAGETIEAINTQGAVDAASGQGTLLASSFIVNPDIDIYSGDVLYTDNRAVVTRTDTQIEDIKIVIQL